VKVQGLVLVAGEGTRLRPLTFTIPKPLIPILGKPIVVRIVEMLRNSGIRNLAFVVGYLGQLFKEVLSDGRHLDVSIRYVVQLRRLGIAHAIHRAIEEKAIDRPFIVYLGDNFFEEGIERFVKEFMENEYDVFIVLTKTKDPTRFGYVVLENGRVKKLIEKPKQPPPGGYTLAGFYAFRDPDLVEKAFKTLKPSWRGEYEITELIQWFIDKGYRIGYITTYGWWKDMGTPEDLLDLTYLMLDKISTKIEGDVRGDVRGRVVVKKGAVIEGTIFGPAYIGNDAYISKNTLIEHYIDVESRAKIEGGSLTRCLILEEAMLKLDRARLIDSIIGSRSYVELVEGDYSLIIGERNRIIRSR